MRGMRADREAYTYGRKPPARPRMHDTYTPRFCLKRPIDEEEEQEEQEFVWLAVEEIYVAEDRHYFTYADEVTQVNPIYNPHIAIDWANPTNEVITAYRLSVYSEQRGMRMSSARTFVTAHTRMSFDTAMNLDNWADRVLPLDLIQLATQLKRVDVLAAALQARAVLHADPPPFILATIREVCGDDFIKLAPGDVGLMFARAEIPSYWSTTPPRNAARELTAPAARHAKICSTLLMLRALPGEVSSVLMSHWRSHTPWVFYSTS